MGGEIAFLGDPSVLLVGKQRDERETEHERDAQLQNIFTWRAALILCHAATHKLMRGNYSAVLSATLIVKWEVKLPSNVCKDIHNERFITENQLYNEKQLGYGVKTRLSAAVQYE